MDFLPAIDILDGKAVRLAQGDYDQVTVYNDDPVLQAQLFEEAGAEWLHVVDLNGAAEGCPQNTAVIRDILDKTGLKVEVGGGIRTLEAIDELASCGVARIVLGTALVKDEALARRALATYGEMLVCGIDARHGTVAVEGWKMRRTSRRKTSRSGWAKRAFVISSLPISPEMAWAQASILRPMWRWRRPSALR